MFLATAVRVLSLHNVLALVLHLDATDAQFVVVARVLGHVLDARVQRHAIIVPATSQHSQLCHHLHISLTDITVTVAKCDYAN